MPVTLTKTAVAKVKEIMEAQDPKPAALRLGVRGGGCSGLQYGMKLEAEKAEDDWVIKSIIAFPFN